MGDVSNVPRTGPQPDKVPPVGGSSLGEAGQIHNTLHEFISDFAAQEAQ